MTSYTLCHRAIALSLEKILSDVATSGFADPISDFYACFMRCTGR